MELQSLQVLNFLFLEDVNEAPYRVDRMLSQLRLAGATARLAGPGLHPAELAGEWQITKVTHRLDGSGLITGFDGKKGAA